MQFFGVFYCVLHVVLLSDKCTLTYKSNGKYEDVQTSKSIYTAVIYQCSE